MFATKIYAGSSVRCDSSGEKVKNCASMRVIALAWMICMRSDHEGTYCVIKSQ